MALVFGRSAYIALNEESTYGTANGSPFGVNNRVFSVSMARNQERERTTHLSQSSAAFAVNTFDGFEIAGGTIETPLTYKGLGLLLKASIGSVATTGSGPYLHTFNPSASLPSLTIAVQRGTGKSEQFEGCKVSTMTISCEAGGEGRASFEIIAETATARAAALGAAGFGDGAQIFHFQGSTLSYNSNTYKMRSMELSLDNKLERVNYLGSKLTTEPQISDVREVTLTATFDLEDADLYNAQLAGTSSNVEATFTNGSDSFAITLRNAEITQYSDDINSFGRIERTATFFGISSGSDEAMRIEMTNDNASAVSN
ncbi:MAG: hypothetical protein Unbinned5179contig1004_25 [Prokaryotic dsDNA virus sp.]|nr:MAG: hypothetical protein Unbinned5179contig1004_25 [Prokaryotic dsDNA virus sp.]